MCNYPWDNYSNNSSETTNTFIQLCHEPEEMMALMYVYNVTLKIKY